MQAGGSAKVGRRCQRHSTHEWRQQRLTSGEQARPRQQSDVNAGGQSAHLPRLHSEYQHDWRGGRVVLLKPPGKRPVSASSADTLAIEERLHSKLAQVWENRTRAEKPDQQDQPREDEVSLCAAWTTHSVSNEG